MSKDFWQVKMLADDKAEILLYGKIVSSRPIDWWTGEPLPGLFVSPEGFLEELEKVKNSSEITIRVNSPGGDVATGQAIYTLLKSLPGKKIGIVDSLAASAATLPLMAADEIRAPAGARIMIHEAIIESWGVFGAQELLSLANMLESVNAATAETYRSKTKLEIDDLRAMMKAETWMTGKEAIDKGFVDTLLFDDADIQMSADRKYLYAGHQKYETSMFSNIPEDIPVKNKSFFSFLKPEAQLIVYPTEEAAKRNSEERLGGMKMCTTVDELRQAYPELCAALCETARADGVKQERERIQAIEEIAKGIGDEKAVNTAKFGDTPVTAQDLAIMALKRQAAMGADFLTSLKSDNAASGVGEVGGAPNGGAEVTENEKRMATAQNIAKYANGGTD